ncbi:GTPase HflX [Convivina intestini]|uniref:GTPase HflX n=1 Tax=Convivina intestini TaxID=1505726 RepID=A0A2U1D7F4_9LACO|nr:GTPase HflX [Convivina intestini]PVY83462.1 GTP-binding protein HflX [Convivina intestini]CAH1855777.1 GTPase HflX [Convivina intestini]SDC20562.1 GTP-binding protein HflX [Leuconostocaceae bacterium R-53105]
MTDNTLRPVLLAGLQGQQDQDIDYELAELANLAEANNLQPVETFLQKLDRPNPATYFGKGKVEELGQAVQSYEVDLIVVNDELSPSQIRNLEKLTDATVVDRTGLILDIFAQRAQTKVAKLQVQLARLQYQLPRLRTSMSVSLDQQTGAGGAGFTSRGSGETKLEQSRRRITSEMVHIRQELAELIKDEDTRTAQRQASQLPTVALVGYTNAGKSTVMNRLLERFGVGAVNDTTKQVFEKNMLFATLNTTVRKLTLADKRQLLLSDTVGFVSKLPHNLVAAFQSTLEAAGQADLLLQVVDVSDPNYQQMMKTTEETLQSIGVTDRPMITVFNKADQTDLPYPTVDGENAITISALDLKSQDELIQLIEQNIFADSQPVTLKIPFSENKLVATLSSEHVFLQEDYTEEGTVIELVLSPQELTKYQAYQI